MGLDKWFWKLNEEWAMCISFSRVSAMENLVRIECNSSFVFDEPCVFWKRVSIMCSFLATVVKERSPSGPEYFREIDGFCLLILASM